MNPEKITPLHTFPTALTRFEAQYPLHNPLSDGIQQTPNPSNTKVKGVHPKAMETAIKLCEYSVFIIIIMLM